LSAALGFLGRFPVIYNSSISNLELETKLTPSWHFYTLCNRFEIKILEATRTFAVFLCITNCLCVSSGCATARHSTSLLSLVRRPSTVTRKEGVSTSTNCVGRRRWKEEGAHHADPTRSNLSRRPILNIYLPVHGSHPVSIPSTLKPAADSAICVRWARPPRPSGAYQY
jgi:hypothetical protein